MLTSTDCSNSFLTIILFLSLSLLTHHCTQQGTVGVEHVRLEWMDAQHRENQGRCNIRWAILQQFKNAQNSIT